MARWAPNHRLTEPWRFLLPGKQTIAKIIDLGVQIASETKSQAAAVARRKRLEDIPGWFVVTSPKSDDPLLTQEDYAACCCAVQNLCLYLWSHDIGVKWTTGVINRDERLFEILQVNPEQHDLVGLFWYGYPRIVPVPLERKPVSDIVTTLP